PLAPDGTDRGTSTHKGEPHHEHQPKRARLRSQVPGPARRLGQRVPRPAGRPSATGSCVHPVCVAAGGCSGCDHAGRREAPRGRAAEPGRRDRGLRPARVPAGLSSAARRRGAAPARGGGPMSARVIHGDCIAEMAKLPADSIDAIVTDPPYGLGFMGKEWDALPPGREWAEECLRVLKPGGHLLAFGGTRTWHRLAVAIEDAGFEIRDSIAWMY